MVRAAVPLLALLLLAAVPADAGISGVVSVTDGGTLNIGDQRIWLHGIDAPESV